MIQRRLLKRRIARRKLKGKNGEEEEVDVKKNG